MKSFHVPLALEHVGEREGFPLNSHCQLDHEGSYCCNLALYNALICAYNELIDQPNFYQYNLRQIAKKLQWDAEEIVQHSMEVIVSYDDFVFRANHQNDRVCKFRVDKYHIFAYETEVKYPLHWPVNVDLGEAKSINCPSKLKELNGQACCNPELQYEIFSTMDEQKQLPGFNKHDTQKMATMLLRRVQRKFNTTFESIVSPAEFVWGTQRYNERVCKIDAGLFSALTFQSSPLPPPSSDFVDLPQSNGGGGTQGPNSGPTDQSVANRATINQLSNQLAQTQRALEIAQSQSQQNAAIAEQSAAQARAGEAQASSYYNSLYQEYQNSNWLQRYCFSDDTWLTTPNGKKRMSEVDVGDFVLTANKTHTFFTPITMWMHREPEHNAYFFTIMTEYGKMLRLSGKHLIFKTSCDNIYNEYIEILPTKAVYADQLREGDCVIVLKKGLFQQQKIQEIWIAQRKGIYAPMTSNGRIFVNDMFASCHSNVKEINIQYKFAEVDLPIGVDLWLNIMDLVTPKYF
ncbi:hypothetical protein WR25_21510 [Diploscapter pachys]|uniref:Hint domain-containing protein n=1 Tax=Diploscapter pachys TaxID=2018661 RepID=A0A2A2KLA9_9BILA|nr:hypothetical protein WR25_21510 [Diploscapter pachys]